jgi:hypothetical protein
VAQTLSVKAATTLQVAAALAEQRRSRGLYVTWALAADAAGTPGQPEVEAAGRSLSAMMDALWRVAWDNERKETLWRLTVNGVPGAGGHDISMPGPCPCGWVGPDPGTPEQQRAFAWRGHYFWDCPVAKAVVSELAAVLPPTVALKCAHVWLLDSPSPAQALPKVWALACMVAIEAMSFGRKALWALHYEELGRGPVDEAQTLITDHFPVVDGASPTVSIVQRASRKAAAWFWCLLQDFVSLQDVPPSWGDVPTSHPFVGVVIRPEGQEVVWRLRLNPPLGFQLPAEL